jgi:hypothetical protein
MLLLTFWAAVFILWGLFSLGKGVYNLATQEPVSNESAPLIRDSGKKAIYRTLSPGGRRCPSAESWPACGKRRKLATRMPRLNSRTCSQTGGGPVRR